MPKYMFAYHGGRRPETPEDGAAEMAKWQAWFADLGDAVVDGGNPVGMSITVSSSGVEDNGGANPLAGYSIIQASSVDAAAEIPAGCPILGHGTVEVAEIMSM